jgi:hypothetical protein
MPIAPSNHNTTGKPPTGDLTSRQIVGASNVGMIVISQITSNIAVAEVDHGSAVANATTTQSASCASCLRSKNHRRENYLPQGSSPSLNWSWK